MSVYLDRVVESPAERPLYESLRISVLDFLGRCGPRGFQQLLRDVGGSDRRMVRLVHEMVLAEELIFTGSRFNLPGAPECSAPQVDPCDDCSGHIVSLRNHADLLRRFRDLTTDRPVPTFWYDQRPVTIETSLRRALYMLWRGDLQGRRVAVLGDDDLTSIAMALVSPETEVDVFDIDSRHLEFISSTARDHGFQIQVCETDFASDAMSQFAGKFDVFVTDPTPAIDPFALFVSTGVFALTSERTGIGYVSFLPSHQQPTAEFQNFLVKRELVITDMVPLFTEYSVINSTYTSSDVQLLELYCASPLRASFFENMTRFLVPTDAPRDIVRPENQEALLGKATRRVMEDPASDPAYGSDTGRTRKAGGNGRS